METSFEIEATDAGTFVTFAVDDPGDINSEIYARIFVENFENMQHPDVFAQYVCEIVREITGDLREYFEPGR